MPGLMLSRLNELAGKAREMNRFLAGNIGSIKSLSGVSDDLKSIMNAADVFSTIQNRDRLFRREDRSISLNVVYENEDFLVVNKPAGLVCHPSKQGELSSLIGRLRLHCGKGSRPQLVNRLDRETSGLVLVAKNEISACLLRELWSGRRVKKEYLAIVRGWVEAGEGCIEAPLGKDDHSKVAIRDAVRPDGQPASTWFEAQKRFERAEGKFSLLKVVPHTGRKHQIRIHLQHLGHPIVGDKIYGGDEQCYLDFIKDCLTPAQKSFLLLPHQALHAGKIAFTFLGKNWLFEAPPEDWFCAFCRIH